jgi:hypothetical protein
MEKRLGIGDWRLGIGSLAGALFFDVAEDLGIILGAAHFPHGEPTDDG